jgi:hypothetical protein
MRCPAKSQIRDASGVRLLLLSSTSPIAAASSCYVERCTGFDVTLVKQASKPEAKRSEARAHTNTHKRAVLFCLAHKHTAKRPGTYSHSSTKNSPSSIIPSRYYPITSMHQFHSHKFNCCFYWGYAIRSRIMHESLGFCNTLINLLKLTSTQIWFFLKRSFLLARHPSHVRYYSIMYMHQFHACKLFLFLLVLCL